MVRNVHSSEKLFIGGDFNGHVGSSSGGFERVHGGFGFGSRNQEGEDILNFALSFDLMIANTFFRKRQPHLTTFNSGQQASQIDFVLTRRDSKRDCVDCKVIPGECVVSQHQLLICVFRLRVVKDKRAKISRTKWWKLKGDASRVFKDRVMGEGAWNVEGEANVMWNAMATCIRRVATEVFGITKGSKREPKDS